MIHIINVLRKMAPHSFILEDANGFNAVEYAIANNADMTAIKTMQQTARDDWRVMKAMGRRKTHVLGIQYFVTYFREETFSCFLPPVSILPCLFLIMSA